MNTKHISLAFAAAAALLAGCAKSPIEEVKTSEQFTDLELAYVGAIETKAAIDGKTFPTEGEIGLFLFKDEQAETPYGESGYSNVKYAYNSSKSKWTANPSIKVGSTSGYLFGYYPYDSEVANVKAIPIASSLNGDDVMYASKQVEPITDKTASSTSIVMNHALARVSITIKNNGYTGAAKFSKIKFGGAKTAENGSLNALDGKITATNSDVTLDVPTANQTITATGSTYECLLVPSGKDESKQAVDLTLTIDGEDKTATLSGDNGVIIAQNTKSNITITLSNSGISVSNVSVEDWNVVEVGGHKVTVMYDNFFEDIEKDVLETAYTEENTAKIVAFSQSGTELVCTIDGDGSCKKTETDNICTFTISNINSDITATLGYQHATGVSLDKTQLSVVINWSKRLTATVIPDNAFNKNIIWTSSDDEIASVVDGVVTGKKGGAATITATTEDGGFTATCIVTVGPLPEGALLGEFSISAHKKVYFSQGNLVATIDDSGVPTAWKFAANQYDYLGVGGANTTIGSGAGDVDLFCWSISTNDTGTTDNYGICTSDLIKDFLGDFFDWGNAIGDGNTWRTLTTAEWKYLCDTRVVNGGTGEGKSYQRATINSDATGVYGLILYPDDYTETAKTSYTCAEWTVMESAGAVFLPAAGIRLGSDISFVGKNAAYWSSSVYDDTKAYMMYFNSDSAVSDFFNFRSAGCSVRLVTDVK